MVEGTHLTTMPTPTLAFYVTRRESNHDDLIKITRANIDTTRYMVSYESEEEPHIPPRMMIMNESEVLEYVRTLVTSLSLDASPFEYLQVTPPAFPSVQYLVSTLRDQTVVYSIINTVRHSLNNWPLHDNSIVPRAARANINSAPRAASPRRPAMHARRVSRDSLEY